MNFQELPPEAEVLMGAFKLDSRELESYNKLINVKTRENIIQGVLNPNEFYKFFWIIYSENTYFFK